MIGEKFEQYGQLHMIRKNRHKIDGQADCSNDDYGVDLNRNYPYKFAFDNSGSAGTRYICYDDFRGLSAASEPETQAMMNFADKWTNLKVVISLHAYGNLFIVPFNYDSKSNNELRTTYSFAN